MKSPDADPPLAGEDTGAPRPAEDTTQTETPDGAGFPAAPPRDEMKQQLARMREKAARAGLLPKPAGVYAPPPPPPDPAAAISARAQRLRGKMPEEPATGSGAEKLRAEFVGLHALFADMLLHSAEGRGFDEKFGLMIALRAQKQALATLLALEKLQAAENIQKPEKP